MTTTLVTGGAGFIGSHVAAELLTAGQDVWILDNLSGGFVENIPDGAHFVHGDIADTVLVDHLFAAKTFGTVYHLAAFAAEGLSHFVRKFAYENILAGSSVIINACVNHGVKCLVFTSSTAVYGHEPAREDFQPSPIDPYGIAKYAVELDLAAARTMFGLNSIVFRLHNVFGNRQNTGDKYRNVIGIFMAQILRGEPCTIFGSGYQTRCFTHVSDMAPIIARSVSVPEAMNQTFNLGSDKVTTVRALLKLVQEAMGSDTGVLYLPARKEAKYVVVHHQKANSVFGHASGVELRNGISEMAAWAKKFGPRQGKPFDNMEITRELPESWKA